MLHILGLVDGVFCHIMPYTRDRRTASLMFWLETVTLVADLWTTANVIVWLVYSGQNLLTPTQLASGSVITYTVLIVITGFMAYLRFTVWRAALTVKRTVHGPPRWNKAS